MPLHLYHFSGASAQERQNSFFLGCANLTQPSRAYINQFQNFPIHLGNNSIKKRVKLIKSVEAHTSVKMDGCLCNGMLYISSRCLSRAAMHAHRKRASLSSWTDRTENDKSPGATGKIVTEGGKRYKPLTSAEKKCFDEQMGHNGNNSKPIVIHGANNCLSRSI